jgi:hypothetical protein
MLLRMRDSNEVKGKETASEVKRVEAGRPETLR